MVRAPTFAPVAQRQRQHAQTVPSASSNLARRTSFHALSSEAEHRSHTPKVEISKFSARTSTASLAQWQSAAATWPRPQDHSLQDAPIGPVTVAAERRGLLIRRRKPPAGSNPAWSTKFACALRPYPNRPRECVESAFNGSSTLPGRTSLRAEALRLGKPLLRYASGEAAALSTRREGFDFPTERQFGISSSIGRAVPS